MRFTFFCTLSLLFSISWAREDLRKCLEKYLEISKLSHKEIQIIADGIDLKKAEIFNSMTPYDESMQSYRSFIEDALVFIFQSLDDDQSIDDIIHKLSNLRGEQMSRFDGDTLRQRNYLIESNSQGKTFPDRMYGSTSERLSNWGESQPDLIDVLAEVNEKGWKQDLFSYDQTFTYEITVRNGTTGRTKVPGHSLNKETNYKAKVRLGRSPNPEDVIYAVAAQNQHKERIYRDSLSDFRDAVYGAGLSERKRVNLIFRGYQKFIISMPSPRGTAGLGDLLLAAFLYKVTKRVLPLPPNKKRRDLLALTLGEKRFMKVMKSSYPHFFWSSPRKSSNTSQ